MNWYTRYLKKQAVQGEWWILDGQAMFCDTDIGEWSHEGYVVDTIASQYVETDQLEETVEDWFFSLSTEEIAELGITPQEAEVIAGGDARKYAMEHLGWQRMAGNDVETWNLTSNDLHNISTGIWDAYDEQAENETFTIYVYSNQKTYWDVPVDVIESGNPIKLIHYRR